ncbi:hypothetical protein [Methylomonas sp. ZR1]|uniref:hypothetical protein n=1 Tax=unclassified Methylomonas TaxID=2608980 RepID=UPI001490FD51|nr:hypothetical protein [Methylomonas sp. ZR1]NOV32196.1 hypothetical protein [Methylomonas sp. ZR1]
MAKRIVWKHNNVVSLKLREDLYSLGQMLGRAAMRFFNITSRDGNWHGIDLNQVDPIFTLFIGNIVLHNLADKKVSDKDVKPSAASCEPYWIKPKLNFDGGYPFKGGNLIDIGTEGNISTTAGRVVEEDLSLPADKEIIEKYELTNMWGDNDVRDRLIHFFDKGEDLDLLKKEVFPGYRA